jgi:hypothetical protein
MSKTGALLGTEKPFEVPAHIGRVQLIVTDSAAKAKTAVGAFMHRSPAQIGIRIAGGCSGMSEADRISMLDYFRTALGGYTGFLSSGATRSVSGRRVSPMVTDVPAVVARHRGNRVLTVSTVPRTGDMALTGDSRLVLDIENDVSPQPGVHMVVVFQPPFAHERLGWDGDVEGYFSLFNAYARSGWPFGMIVWNGGDVTKKEVLRAAGLGWRIFLVDGSGRQADELAIAARGRKLPGDISIVQRRDPQSLRRALAQHGFTA